MDNSPPPFDKVGAGEIYILYPVPLTIMLSVHKPQMLIS